MYLPVYEIEKDIPIPARKNVGSLTMCLRSMAVGDSVYIPRGQSTGWAQQVKNVAAKTGWKYTTRKLEGGRRIWRTE